MELSEIGVSGRRRCAQRSPARRELFGFVGPMRHHSVSVTGGGHNAPSITERLNGPLLERFGPQNADIETAELTWAFFEDKTR
jgi:hypothetical protein